MTIDHVMVDRSFGVLNGWVERRGSSDHSPVVAHVEVRPRQNTMPSWSP